MINIEQVIEFTKLDIHKVYELSVIEFLNYLSYAKSKILYHNEKVKKRMSELKNRSRRRR